MFKRSSLTISTLFFFFAIKIYLVLPIDLEVKRDSIDQLIIFLEAERYDSKRILANGAHILKYYLEYDQIENLVSLSKDDPGFFQRRNNIYTNIEQELKKNFYDIVIINRNSDFNNNSFKKLINFGYKEYKIEEFNVYLVNN